MKNKIIAALLLAPEKKGMRVNGMRYLQQSKGTGYADMRRMMAAHLEELAREYYAGNIEAVDEFLQLYCIGESDRANCVVRAQQEQIPDSAESISLPLRSGGIETVTRSTYYNLRTAGLLWEFFPSAPNEWPTNPQKP